MAKRTHTYSDFSKGLVSFKNPRDLARDEVPNANGIMFDEGGQIRPMGQFLVIDGHYTYTNSAIIKGYGFIGFRSDYNLAGGAVAGGITIFAYTDTNVGSTTKVFLKDTAGNVVTIVMGSGNTNGKIVFYFVDGALRISDSLITNTSNYVWWFGHTSHNYFNHSISGWKSLHNDLPAPTVSLAQASPSYGSAGVSIQLAVSQTTTSGGESGAWNDEEYEFAVSWVYLGDQESKLFGSTGTLTMVAKQQMKVNMLIKEDADYTGGGSNTNTPRLIGARAYTRLRFTDDNWMLIIDANLDSSSGGIRSSIYTPSYTGWTESSDDWTGGSVLQIKAPPPVTYEILNGHRSGDVGRLAFGGNSAYNWSTATTGVGRAFVANVNYVNEQYTSITAMNDRILFTPVGKYDCFPSNYWIDIGINDGDEIIKMSFYGAKLLVWKKSVFYVVDVSGDTEDSWKITQAVTGMGVSNHAAVMKFEDGCAWVNESGCYLYTEKGLERLTTNISNTEWTAFVDPANCIIGYVPTTRQIVVLGDAATDGDEYIYDRNTESWSKGVMAPFAITNMDVQDNLLYAQARDTTLKVYKWSNTTYTNNEKIYTKDEDFNSTGVFKKVYSVIISYKLTSSTYDYLELQYGIDGAVPGSIFGSRTPLADDGAWRKVVFTNSTPIKCQSISFAMFPCQSGGTAADSPFWVNDISIEYRLMQGAIIDA